ncbi:MAG: hypothetical protein ACREKS_23765 [Candidatus Rokuibacteriota bacterium]
MTRSRLLTVVGVLFVLGSLLLVGRLLRMGSAPPEWTSAPPPATSPPSGAPSAPDTSPPPAEESPPSGAPSAPVTSPPPALPAFPWPPPKASAEHQIRRKWVADSPGTQLKDVAERIETALDDARYETWRHLSVPHGFALVTQLEQIRPDGTPLPDKERFRSDLPSFADLSFVEFLKVLAKAPPGHYRVIVFVVTDTPFAPSATKPTEREAQQWLAVGWNRLPSAIGDLPYGDDYRTTALIYQFKRASKNDPAAFVATSPESGRSHLEKARIWSALTR